ncbi:MAG: hypothetical protein AAB851_01330 [Patescibacteria group bacterium]
MLSKFNLNQKIIILLAVIILIGAMVSFLALFGYLPWLSGIFSGEKIVEEDINLITSAEAIEFAKPDALNWKPDAKLAQINAKGKMSLISGKNDSWILIFSSPSAENKGYEISVSNRQIVSKKEIVFRRQGADLPENGLIGDEEAIKKLREISGYESATVQSVELIPSADGKAWFYGIKTDKGVITLPAER